MRNLIADVALSGGRLAWTERDAALPPAYDVPLLSRTLIRARDGRLTGLGARNAGDVLVPVVMYPSRSRGPALSLSGGRALTRFTTRYVLWSEPDSLAYGTTSAGWPPDGLRVRQSGAWSLVGGRVQVTDLGMLDTRLDLGDQPADLYGPRVIWRTPGGPVLYRNLATGKGARVLAGSGAAGPVAIGAHRYAWVDADGRIVVHDWKRTTARVVPAEAARAIRLDGDVLSWTDRENGVHTLDLGRSGSAPVATGLVAPYQIDDDVLAGVTASGEIEVRRLALAVRARPELISSLAPERVTGGQRWRAQFDVTAPIGRPRLRIRRDGKVIRTLTPKGRHDLIRVTWDGRTGSGRTVRPGRYRWTLTGTGLTAVGGTVEMTGER
ncbi:hypothetical protein KIH74_06030 [Kineosporia sp. J2-2]|uniref:FlgD Ig-like domain-containing protein n=1 Tax=Kineosporia corallincola TaxID=2835133 RepID=A0ABS5TFU3_9ACTN|nr:hypothetical protein [Kineosporia corallincola]MBT0768474.1 hypothetical protein [Kineosporia corallincola]